ncbi:hypothetical protein [Streptomyces sp. NBC_01803]|uniref:hypothetical protein n=1 Tax=Streptomyces sp. NBC_01803 TaxID=2975946 RepID=UPI002DD995A8|nr:hypothetical protein [Streptomyces sp. NBC_01803]WSA46807.1 hypothetical protein OIE51_23050 [Streptomyces sp. NBC_01803]
MSGTTPDVRSVDVRRYFEVPRHRWRTVLAVAVLGVGAVGGYAALAPSSYEATSLVRVSPVGTDPFSSGRTPDQLVNTDSEAQIARSSDVAGLAAASLPGGRSPEAMRAHLAVTPSSDTATLRLTYDAGSQQAAIEGVNAFATAYLAHREADARARQEEMLRDVEEALDEARAALLTAEEALASAVEGSAQAREADADRQFALRDVQALSDRRGDLRAVSFEPGSVLDEADRAAAGSPADDTLFLAGGVLAALVLAVAAAFARDRLDRRVGSGRGAGEAAGAPLLAEIPVGTASLALVEDPAGPAAESYRMLRALLVPALRRRGTRVLLVADLTGPAHRALPGANLATALAEALGDVVLLTPGWRGAAAPALAPLAAAGGTGKVTLHTTTVTGLRVAHGEATDGGLRDVIAGEEFRTLVTELTDGGAWVVLDSSGDLTPSEVITLAGTAGAAVLVARSRETATADLASLATALERLDTPIAGCALVVPAPTRKARHTRA